MSKDKLDIEIQEAADKATDSLARYKFAMFGYWAGIWVHLNRIDGGKRPSPFRDLVKAARTIREEAMTPTQKRQSFLTTNIIKQQKWVLGFYLVFVVLWVWLVQDSEFQWIMHTVSGCVTFYFTSRLLQLARMNRERKART